MSSLGFLLAAGIPVIFGGGESISHLEDIPATDRASVAVESGFGEPSVGLKYEYFSLFFLDLWTGGGRVVLYDEVDGDRYVPLDDEQTKALVGVSPSELGTPFLYKVPLGWLVIGPLLLVFGARFYLGFRESWRGGGL